VETYQETYCPNEHLQVKKFNEPNSLSSCSKYCTPACKEIAQRGDDFSLFVEMYGVRELHIMDIETALSFKFVWECIHK